MKNLFLSDKNSSKSDKDKKILIKKVHILKHRNITIKSHILTNIPLVKKSATVKDVLGMLEEKKNKYEAIEYLYVVDRKKNLVGMFYIKDLFDNPKNTLIKKFMKTKIVTVSLNMELEKAAHIALEHNLKQVPVTKAKKFIGVVSTREILLTINRSLKKDIFHFAGLHKSHLEFENSLKISFFNAVKGRISWLLIGFIGAIAMALYIGLFEKTLAKNLIIAAFVPAIVYISGAVATQFQTIFVRDLAILGKELDFKEYFFKQFTIGFFIASIMGLLMFISVSLIWKEPHIAFVIALASFASLIITGAIALLITLLIKRFNFDPALGSGPIATVISDLSSVIIYFITVALLI